jgi:G3E family GTPase
MSEVNYEVVDHALSGGPVPIPVTILTGFLGAGKTTLLNRILNGEHGLRVAVLVNDFGSINIDADLVVGVEDDVISLANGCVCCTMRDDLSEAVTSVIERPERPEYILLEASGVADPSGIAVTFLNPNLRERVRLDSITCVVDADQVFAAPEQMELKIRQVAFSDMVLLNKVDLVDEEQHTKIREWLDKWLHRYRLMCAVRCDVPLEILLSVGRFDPSQMNTGKVIANGCTDGNCNHEHHHDPSKLRASFSTWSFETHRPLSLDALRTAASKLPANIYRAKGVVYSSDAPERRAVLQVVGKRVDISLQDEWGERPPRTRIVTIGSLEAIEASVLQGMFEQCFSGCSRR